MIKIIKQDLFKIKGYPYAHCISSDWAMGAGIATSFQNKYKIRAKLHSSYQDQCGIFPVVLKVESKGDTIFNLVTKNKYWNKPTLDNLNKTLLILKDQMDVAKIKKIAMPKIGCGLDRLQWDEVEDLLKNIFSKEYDIIICYL